MINLRKSLIKLAGKLELDWQKVDFSAASIPLKGGWYVTEFLVQGVINHTPRMVIRDSNGKEVERTLIGFHSGRNRMLIYLPSGYLIAYSKSIEFDVLGRVSTLEGRARVLLICFRYLIDFFSLRVFFRMIFMQFLESSELSTQVLQFYSPQSENYLSSINKWNRFRGFEKILAWWCRGYKIAVVIEEDSQRFLLADQLVPADAILLSSDNKPIPEDIDYVIPLRKTERLRDASILILKRALKKSRHKPSLVYTDHEYLSGEVGGQKLMEPVFKSGPSQIYLHCYNYVGPAVMFARSGLRSSTLQEIINYETRYHLALKYFNIVENVMHISELLFVSDHQSSMLTPIPLTHKSAWPNIVWRRRNDYNVLIADEAWEDFPSVDLVIPTRDGLAVLKPCIDSLLAQTNYPNFNIIVVDNGSELSETHDYLEQVQQDQRVTIIDYPGEFNYSAINNFAVAKGNSDYVALINNDIEVIHTDWLTQMMVWVTQPNVGVVGAKLLFGNGLVQHAGVIIGMGNAAGHIHRLEEGDSPGYQNRCIATQNMMAVTAACLVTPRKLFEELGGLDEEFLKVAYNDIDYCLRVEKLGYDIVWTPEARLYHHESVSRGDDMSERHIERYFYELGILQKRWKTKGFVDKYYNRHLRSTDEGVYPQINRTDSDELLYIG